MVIGHALVEDEGGIHVYLDCLPNNITNFKIHAEGDPVALGNPHILFTQVREAIKHLYAHQKNLGDTAMISSNLTQLAINILETLPGYQDWLDDQYFDEVERG